MNKQARERVNGLMSQNIGKAVNVVGAVVQIEPSGRSLTLKTFSEDVITVQLQEPVQGLLQRTVEVHGTVCPNNTLQCQKLVTFKEEDFLNDTDMELYKEVISTSSRLATHYITMV